MRILAAIDDSPCSAEVLREVCRRPWPEGSEVRILSVAHPLPWVHDPFQLGGAIHVQSQEEESARAAREVQRAAAAVRDAVPELEVSTTILEGPPEDKVVEEAARWHADLVLVGSHGKGAAKRLLLGSVSQTVAANAPCSVEIVRAALA